jgi:hypothetical protein
MVQILPMDSTGPSSLLSLCYDGSPMRRDQPKPPSHCMTQCSTANVATTVISAGNGSVHTLSTTPRRMFLCDVPLFTEQTSVNRNDGVDYVRLMGTVVEIIRTSSTDISYGINPQNSNENASTSNEFPATHLIHFVIDDGTGSIEVFTKRRVAQAKNSNCSTNILRPTTQQQIRQSTKQNQRILQPATQTFSTMTLESILSSPPPPILAGQTVDCIGWIRIDTVEGLCAEKTKNEKKRSPLHGLRLAASSVSIMNDPQAITLRHLELSFSPRWKIIINARQGNGVARNINSPKNRILVGGYLERKLNPLYHCDYQGSVVFNMEEAFNYIKHSKDDGGITQKELSSLVGAVEPNEVLAVNLAVEQLREDCRIYINQGKWFPM